MFRLDLSHEGENVQNKASIILKEVREFFRTGAAVAKASFQSEMESMWVELELN